MSSTSNIIFTNISATTDPFTLEGGSYAVLFLLGNDIEQVWQVQILGPDTITWVPVNMVTLPNVQPGTGPGALVNNINIGSISPFFTADLPDGTYRIALTVVVPATPLASFQLIRIQK